MLARRKNRLVLLMCILPSLPSSSVLPLIVNVCQSIVTIFKFPLSVADIDIGKEFKHEPIFEDYPQQFVTPCSSSVDSDSNSRKFLTCKKIDNTDRFFKSDNRKVCDKKSIGDGDDDENKASNTSRRNRIRSNSQQERYKCKICPSDYKHKGNLTTHVRLCHGIDGTIFSCDHCSYSIKWKQNLAKHIKGKHDESSNSRYSCDICNKTYKWKDSLNLHWRTSHGMTTTFNCDYCNYSAKHKVNLVRHIKVKHDSTKRNELEKCEKPYKCKNCNKAYACQSSLWSHRKLECGKKPSFFCKFCVYSCKRKIDMKKHIENIHEAKPKFKCMKCARLYKYKSDLTKHMKYSCNK